MQSDVVKRISLWTVVLVVGMLATGTLNTITKKVQNDAVANGTFRGGKPHTFEHPWFQTWLMFLGEMLCILGYGFVRWREWSSARAQRSGIDTESDAANVRLLVNEVQAGSETPTPTEEPTPQGCFQWILILPTALDLTGTTLAGIGLLYIKASVWQMLRGSMVIFRYLFTITMICFLL
jgi:hypothetical protein